MIFILQFVILQTQITQKRLNRYIHINHISKRIDVKLNFDNIRLRINKIK